MQLTSQQQRAYDLMYSESVSAVTGYAGTGKSTLISHALRHPHRIGERTLVLAPTNKAVARMRMLARDTRADFATIHKVIGWNPRTNECRYDADNPIEGYDTIVVDETSMVSLWLARNLLRAISRGTRTVFCGDPLQLPSIEKGLFLRDLIRSEYVPTAELTEVLRAAGLIAKACESIRLGFPWEPMPQFEAVTDDRNLIAYPCKYLALTDTLKAVFARIDQTEFDPIWGTLCIAATNRCVTATNSILQQVLNPNGETVDDCPFRTGDKVVRVDGTTAYDHATESDKQVQCFASDFAEVIAIEKNRITLRHTCDETDFFYVPGTKLNGWQLGYCVTVHRAQGDESPIGIVVMEPHTRPGWLDRQWAYVALSRAKKLGFIVGESPFRRDARSKSGGK